MNILNINVQCQNLRTIVHQSKLMFNSPPAGQYQTPSRIQDVHTYASFPPMDQMSQSTVASSGWFIGMVLALLFLASVCVVVCLIKVNINVATK